MALFPLQDAVASWGHEYIRSLSGEIGDEYHARREKDESVQDLLDLVAQIVPFHMTHNAGLTSFLPCMDYSPHIHRSGAPWVPRA